MMREPRKTVGRRLVRREGESDAEYLVAAEHHLWTIHLGRAYLLRIAMERAIASIKLDDDINLRALSDIANVLLTALRETRNGSDDAIRELEGELIAAKADSQLRLQDVVDDSLPVVPRVTAEAIMTIDSHRRAELWAMIDRPPEIVRRPGIMSGDWVIWGTRVRPETIEPEIAAGQNEEQILAAYPMLPAGVVAAVQRWRKIIDMITTIDDGVLDVLDYELVQVGTSRPPAIVYLAADKIGVHGDFVVEAGDLDMPDLIVSSGRVGDLIDKELRSQLEVMLGILVARWERKKTIAGEDLSWDAWQRRIDDQG